MPGGLLSLVAPGVGMTPSGLQRGLLGAAPQSLVQAPGVQQQPRPGVLSRLLPVPDSMQGLLSDSDAHQARTNALLTLGSSLLDASSPVVGGPAPSLGAALGRGLQAGMGAFQQGIEGAAGRNAQLAQTQLALDDARRQRAARAVAGQTLLPQDGESREQYIQRLQGGLAAAVAGGDNGTATTIGQVLQTLAKPVPPKPLQQFNQGNQISIYDPNSGHMVGTLPVGPKPVDPETRALHEAVVANSLDTHQLTAESRLVGQYHMQAKNYIEGMQAVRQALTLKDAALQGDPMAQLALVQAAIKARHPNQAVRPTEMMTMEDARGLLDEVGVKIGHMVNGQKLTAGQVQAIVNTLGPTYNQHQAASRQLADRYRRRMEAAGLDTTLLDDGTDVPQVGGAGAASGAPGSASNVDRLLGRH